MLHFYKLSRRIIDEPVIRSKSLRVKYFNNIVNDISKDHVSNECDANEEFIESSDLKNVKELAKSEDFKKRHCIIKCKNPKLNFYENQTYSKFVPIPLASRGWQHRKSRGDHFTIYPVKNNIKGEIDESRTFKDININRTLIRNLEEKHIINPTMIQILSIPKILNKENIIMTAETGCGKTIAYLLPLLHQIIQWKSVVINRKLNSPLALIITPSYDLTHQIYKEAKQLVQSLNLNITKFVGGKSKKIANNAPNEDFDLIIASLGVLSKLVTWEIINLKMVRHVVLDEADVLLDPTFRDKMCYFLERMPIETKNIYNNSEFPSSIQLTLSSATIPQDISETLHMFKNKNKLVPVTSGNQHQITVPQIFLRVGSIDKISTLLKLIKNKIKNKTPVIIFSNTIKTCDFVSYFLNNFGINCLNLHGDLPRELKKNRFRDFHDGKFHILTTTDAGARGLDTTMVKEIINFDFPLITSEYIHRCGRTGRIGSPMNCRVVNFISKPLEIVLTSKIEFAVRKGNPIPLIDTIHDKDQQENEFLNYKTSQANVNTMNQECNELSTFNSDYTVDFDTRIPQ